MRWVLPVAALLACGGGPEVVVEVHTAGLDPARLSALDGRLEADARGARVRVAAGTAVVIDHPEACRALAKAPGEVTLEPLLTVKAPPMPVGFDSGFDVEAGVGCGLAGEVSWRQVSGPRLLEASASGRSFHGRTHKLETLRPGPLPWGIVPLSPSTQGLYVLEVTLAVPGRAPVVRQVRVLAAARATGVPSLAVGAPVILGGEGWRLKAEMPGAELRQAGGLTIFTATRAGRWQLVDGGRTLGVRANRHDETPLDCGRSECHPAATEGVKDSPMTQVLARGLEGRLGDRYDARCALACHAVGEPGLEDGGFSDVAARLGAAVPARASWASLPRELRRLGGVGCTSCHGPAAIPEAGARWSILRADVCATCHDAPPEYGLVALWRGSRMARADAAPGTSGERCRDCHTTAGFLAAAGVRKLGAADLGAEADVGPAGVACAACHAPHGAHGARLVRALPAPTVLGAALPETAAASAVCLRCHAPLDDQAAEGSAGALWLGRGGRRLDDGSPLTGAAPHAGVACSGCHDASGHSFAPVAAKCAPCHDAAPRVDGAVATRAADLWARLGGTARHPARGPGGLDAVRARAAWNISLVLEDPAAAVHNAPYARALLDQAEQALR